MDVINSVLIVLSLIQEENKEVEKKNILSMK